MVRTLRADSSFFSLAFNPVKGIMAVGDASNTVRIWLYPDESGVGGGESQTLHTFQLNAGSDVGVGALIWDLDFSQDGSWLAAGSGDGHVYILDVEQRELLATLPVHLQAVTSVAFHPIENLLATGGLDSKVRIWQMRPRLGLD
jgi:WD40 repeat protein